METPTENSTSGDHELNTDVNAPNAHIGDLPGIAQPPKETASLPPLTMIQIRYQMLALFYSVQSMESKIESTMELFSDVLHELASIKKELGNLVANIPDD